MKRLCCSLAAFALILAAHAHAQTPYLFPTNGAFSYSPAPPVAPAAAAMVGYTTLTFNSTTLGSSAGQLSKCVKFYGFCDNTAVQNGDGSFTVTGTSILPQVGTATRDTMTYAIPYQFDGTAFGCGMWAQAKMQWPPGTGAVFPPNFWPAFWSVDVEMASGSGTTGVINSSTQWPGLTASVTAGSANITLNFDPTNVWLTQNSPAWKWSTAKVQFTGSTGSVTGLTIGTVYFVVGGNGPGKTIQISTTSGGTPITFGGSGTSGSSLGLAFGHWVEPDFMEYENGSNLKIADPDSIHDDFGVNGTNANANTNFSAHTIAAGFLNSAHTYGVLWVPATSGVANSGYMAWYIDGAQVGIQTWSSYSGSNQPPALASAAQLGSIIDQRHLILFINGGGSTYPVTVTDFEVWQGSGACNIVH
jgi:hypothetical protein